MISSFKQWFEKKPYTKAAMISALASVFMALMSGIMAWSLFQNNDALRSSAESLRLQQAEFRIRNRPIIDIKEARFGGPIIASDQSFPRSIEIVYDNLSDILATQLKGTATVRVASSGAVDITNVMNDLGSMSKGQKGIPLGITEKMYSSVVNDKASCSIHIVLNYSGMLDEDGSTYSTECIINYYHDRGTFIYSGKKFK